MSFTSTRYCKRCRQRREVNWRNPGSLDYCAKCLRAVERKEPTKAKQEARSREASRKKQRIEETLAWVDDFKRSRGCLRCGETDPSALDCHHKDPAKPVNVLTLVRRRPTLSVVAKELANSVVLCASCHRKERPARTDCQIRGSRLTASKRAGALDAPLGAATELDLRRASLVEALQAVKVASDALHGTATRDALKQRAALAERRRSLSVSLMKLDAEIAARTSSAQPTIMADEDLP